MFPASRWAARLSRPTQLAARRTVTTKSSGISRKIPRTGLPRAKELGSQHRSSEDRPQQYASSRHQQDLLDSGRQDESVLHNAQQDSQPPPSRAEAIQNALQASASSSENTLVAPVHIPEDPLGILKPDHPAMSILGHSTLIIQRQMEMMNLMIGFEQANKYVIMDELGNHIGYLAEPEGNMLKRQMFKTHRGFTVHVFDKHEREVLRITRPFTFINSRIGVYDAINPDPSAVGTSTDALQNLSVGSMSGGAAAQLSPMKTEEMRVIGEVHQQWAPLRRKYNLFLNRPAEDAPEGTPQLTAGELPLSNSTALTTVDERQRPVNMAQWAYSDEPFLSWDFSLLSEDARLLGSVNRNFAGFAREIFTDTGVYALRMDSATLAAEPRHIISKTGESSPTAQTPGMTLDQRAVMLATAVSIDFDYFSRHSGRGGMLPMPMWLPWGGGAAEAGAGAGAAGAGAAEAGAMGGTVGAAEGAGMGGLGAEVGAAARGAGAVGYGADAGAAGAGSIAGYEAMQRGFGRGGDDASPTAQDPYDPQSPQTGSDQQQGESFWGEQSPWDQQQSEDPWGQQGGEQSPLGGAGGDGSGGGDGGGFSFWDLFGGDD